MRGYQHATCLGMAAFALSVPLLLAQSSANDPIIGNWELNVAKSKYVPGPAPKSDTRTYLISGQTIRATSKVVDSAGRATTTEWIVSYDGKDHALTGDPDADAVAFKRIDALTTEFTEKKAGKVVMKGTRTFSQNGKVMTIASKGTTPGGESFNNVLVFEKR